MSTSCPEASDDARFNHALLASSAAWLAALASYLPSVIDTDRKLGRSTVRQRIVTALDHFVVLSSETGQFGALADASDSLAERLRREWGRAEVAMRPCNAFGAVEL